MCVSVCGLLLLAVLEIREVGVSSWQSGHDIRFVSPDGGDFQVPNESTISALRWKYVFLASRKTIFLGNTSVLGVRALNNVGTWVTYWKRWLYAGHPPPDRSRSVLDASFFSSYFRLRLLSASLPFTFDPFLPDLLGARNPTNCRQSHICRISTLARYWLPLSSCHTTANSPHVYRRDHVCEISMLRDINQKNGISVAARWFTRWQKLYREEIFGAKEYCCATRYVDLIR